MDRNMPMDPQGVREYFADMGIGIEYVMGPKGWAEIEKRLEKLSRPQRPIRFLSLFGL